MNILVQINLAAFLFSLTIIGHLVLRKNKSLLNLFSTILFSCFAIWSFGDYCVFSSITPESAYFWTSISAIGWIIFPIPGLYFCLALAEKDKILKSRLLLLALVLTAAFFIAIQWSPIHLVEQVRKPFGWTGIWNDSLYSYLYFIYFIGIAIISVYFILEIGRKSCSLRVKKQSRVLALSGAVSLILGVVTNIVLVNYVPPLGNTIVTFFWGLGIYLSITKYGLMSISPVTASDQILSTMTDSLLLLDTQGIIKMANPATVELLEIPEKELTGTDFRTFVADKKDAEELLTDTIHSGVRINHELIYQSESGRSIPVLVSASCVLDKLKTTIGFVVVARDITERQKMEERIVNLYEKEKAQRQELEEEAKARGLFIDILAHELRTPLTPILASVSLLKDLYESQPDGIYKQLTANISNGSRILASRLEELLDLARYSRGTFKLNSQPTNMNTFINEVTTRFTPSLNKSRQQFILEISENLPVVELDQSCLEQVLVNLLSNASKYSPEKSCIRLTVKSDMKELQISVTDNGVGIPAEEQSNLFKPYHRVQQDRQRHQGLGLGLAVCKQIVEAHKGKIWMESQPGHGSTFYVAVPLKQTL